MDNFYVNLTLSKCKFLVNIEFTLLIYEPMNAKNNNQDTSMNSMFSYLNRVQKYIKKYAEDCSYAFNSMFKI